MNIAEAMLVVRKISAQVAAMEYQRQVVERLEKKCVRLLKSGEEARRKAATMAYAEAMTNWWGERTGYAISMVIIPCSTLMWGVNGLASILPAFFCMNGVLFAYKNKVKPNDFAMWSEVTEAADPSVRAAASRRNLISVVVVVALLLGSVAAHFLLSGDSHD
jgi:hypothetical protein